MPNKLTIVEINEAADRIRQKYNDIIVTYMLSPKIKNLFDERFNEVKKTGFNIPQFFADELKDIQKIEQREKEKINKAAQASAQKKSDEFSEDADVPKKDFADKILEQIMAKIEKYPALFIHKNENEELSKLFGALIEFDKNQWSVFEKIGKKYRINRNDLIYAKVDVALNNLARIYYDTVPARLVNYKNMLNSPFSANVIIGKEEKMCIVDCAFLIRDIKKTIKWFVASTAELLDNEKAKLAEIDRYLDQLLEDFRIKEFAQM